LPKFCTAFTILRMMPEARVAPPIAAADASRILRDAYGIAAAARSVPGEYDDNFFIEAADSCAFVLKIMHPAREDSFVDMQCCALMHLASRAPELALPRVVPAANGQLFSRTRVEDDRFRLVWLLTYLPGHTLAQAKPHSPELLASLGQFLGQMDSALLDFEHRATERELKWDLSRSLSARSHLSHINDPQRRGLVEKFLGIFEKEAAPRLPQFRRSVIYGDANDHNVLVSPPWPQPRRVVGVIDFGDMHTGVTVGEPAIAAAYAMMGEEDPLAAACAVLAGYHSAFPLNSEEIAAFYALMCARLAFSVVNSAHRRALVPDDPYVTVSEAPAWAALERLARTPPSLAHYRLRAACGMPPVPQNERVTSWLAKNSASAAPVLPIDLRQGNCLVLDLSVGSALLGGDPARALESDLVRKVEAAARAANAQIVVGRYNEARSVYSSAKFGAGANPVEEWRTVHLGMDLFAEPGTNVSAPFAGTVYAFADSNAPLDYGPVILLRHETGDGSEFFTLYGHLSRASLSQLRVGESIARGQGFAHIGNNTENGGWFPHLHFQIILDHLGLATDFPGVGLASQRDVFTSLSPDPNLTLGIPDRYFPAASPSPQATLSARKKLLGGNLSVSYHRPLKIVRGWRQYLYDDTGRAYLDVYNNVPLVGHSHPRVTQAATDQLAVLNTNTRYLHDNVLRYAERLTALLPESLCVCYFLNSGSEANELGLRLARTHTRRKDVIVLDHAYHGNTSTLIDISPYKFEGPGRPWVHVAPIPDDYRGLYRRGDSDLGKKYSAHVAEILEKCAREGKPIAAYIAETLPSVAGQIVFPPEYLAEVYRYVRAAGGLCIADEVQVGFGRLGTHFWGFETQGVVPDIVVLGKPIGNAFPLAAVITTPEIAASFANGMEFFSTFGGNPVACAAGLAVLDVLREESLQENARLVGADWKGQLERLQAKFPIIGDVRGAGLFLGIDLVNDRATRAPAADQADCIVNRLRDSGILTGTDGPHHNVIKLRPPLIFSKADADLFNSTLERILQEDPAQPLSR
jgi:4-aminobutyrate aminotransferase-like enzyme/Ser/Thr protein kinase RdoA (MazF antagonist)